MPRPTITGLARSLALSLMLSTATFGAAWPHAVSIGAYYESGEALSDHPVPANTETRILVRFNANVERGFVSAALVGRGGAELPVGAATHPRPGTVVFTLPPLRPGKYVLRYKVLAADGHLTEDVVRFTVAE